MKTIGGEVIYDSDQDKFVGVKLNSPLSVCWQITRKCNLKCKYCLSDSGPNQPLGMGTEDALKVIRHLGELNVARLDFTGGEPLLRNDLEELLAETKKQGITTLVTTNTLLLDDDKLKYLKKYSPIVQVSVDGPKEVHNTQRGAEVYTKTIENIKRLKDAGCKVRINSFIFADNLQYIDYLLDLSTELGIFSHLFILFTPQGRGADHLDQVIPADKVEEIKQKLIKRRDETGFYIRMYDYKEYEHSCVLLEPDGGVISQGFYQKNCIRLGNILETPLNELFNNKHFNHTVHLLHYLQKRVK